jgi:putative oxidoreductase
MKKLISIQSFNTDLATLFLRLLFGGMFTYYGYVKFVNYDTILPMFGDIIGIGSKLSFNLVIFAELICGFLILIGLLTRFAVIPVFITMVVAYFIAHGKDPFDAKAIAFVFMILCLVVFTLGSGKYSIDALLFKNNPNKE